MNKKFCYHCGAEVHPEAIVCVHCGCSLQDTNKKTKKDNDGLETAIKIFMIIGVVLNAFWLIPLIWCIPMYKKVNNYLEGKENLTTGYKVCVLLFVNLVAGILLLVDDNN